MIHRAGLVWMMAAITAGVGLFLLKYEVKAMEEQLATVNDGILRNLEAVHVMKAEWSFLNRPARLEELGRRLLALEPMDAQQTAAITDIPLRPPLPPALPEGREAPAAAPADDAVSPAAGRLPPSLASYRRER